ncbi:MAG: spermidine synthase [Akkermansiaceae bacterium]|nr:spermidine synthase [Akkermansiaceae bacterium]
MKITRTLAETRTPDGYPMILLEHDGEFFLKVNGVQLMSTTATASEQQMADLAYQVLSSHPPGRVLIGGLGFGFTLRRVMELGGAATQVLVAELMPEILAWNRTHLHAINGHFLDDPKVEVRLEDVAVLLKTAATPPFDVILLDVDNGPDALVAKRNDGLYGRRGFQIIRAALSKKGVVVFWSANPDRAFADSLERSGFTVQAIGAKAYPKAKKFSHTLFVARPK